ncbi:hypothetical protein WJX75_003916 [Coccomyxa subellipsoidea]|uniref:Uncharacterized protein n=1 Tax=Coccomyxa subellipsoidea TaxID=248742 RepID=A0ABR2YXZ1_9CHLO
MKADVLTSIQIALGFLYSLPSQNKEAAEHGVNRIGEEFRLDVNRPHRTQAIQALGSVRQPAVPVPPTRNADARQDLRHDNSNNGPAQALLG